MYRDKCAVSKAGKYIYPLPVTFVDFRTKITHLYGYEDDRYATRIYGKKTLIYDQEMYFILVTQSEAQPLSIGCQL